MKTNESATSSFSPLPLWIEHRRRHELTERGRYVFGKCPLVSARRKLNTIQDAADSKGKSSALAPPILASPAGGFKNEDNVTGAKKNDSVLIIRCEL